jgi:DNA repair and recombination protein RAD54B
MPSLKKAPDSDDGPIALAGPSRSLSSSSTKGYKTVQSSNFYGAKPSGDKIIIGEKSSKLRKEWGGALHDPRAEGAVVMPRPPVISSKG